jgi:hypothetical protein
VLKPLLALALLAAPAASPRPGLWTMVATPGTATLDGRPLDDLPYTPPPADAPTCRTLAELHDPAALVVAHTPDTCRETRRTRAPDGIRITGRCAAAAPGAPRGRYTLEGRWTADSYTIRFATTNPAENGVMGFSGTIQGRRVGEC